LVAGMDIADYCASTGGAMACCGFDVSWVDV